MTFDPNEAYGDDKVLLKVEGEFQGYGLTAYCSPDAEGRTFLLDGDLDLQTTVRENFGAPFGVDVVLAGDQHPQEPDMQNIRDELGDEFENKFDAKVDAVHEKIEDADEPLDAILDLEPDDLILEEVPEELE